MQVIKRKSCRAILLTPESEVLLIKIANPTGSWCGWITPGGGMDEGESEEEALKRELFEELGMTEVKNPMKVWKRFHSFPWNDVQVEQHEVYFLVRVERFEPSSQTNLTESEMLEFKEMKWWALEELKQSNELFAPRDLLHQLSRLINDGPPAEPIEVGI